jgi:hypothetical protein
MLLAYRKIMTHGATHHTFYAPDIEATNFFHPKMMLPDSDFLARMEDSIGVNTPFLYIGLSVIQIDVRLTFKT